VTIHNLTPDTVIPDQVIEDMMTQHLRYPEDMLIALEAAKKAGFKSCALVGFRTPNPYGDDEVAEITVRGMVVATDFQAEVMRIIKSGGEVSPEAILKVMNDGEK
jgi:hypothetical protein